MGDHPRVKRTALSVREAASRIGVHYVTCLKLLNNGHLRGVKKGGNWHISEEEIERFNKEGNYQPPKEEETTDVE